MLIQWPNTVAKYKDWIVDDSSSDDNKEDEANNHHQNENLARRAINDMGRSSGDDDSDEDSDDSDEDSDEDSDDDSDDSLSDNEDDQYEDDEAYVQLNNSDNTILPEGDEFANYRPVKRDSFSRLKYSLNEVSQIPLIIEPRLNRKPKRNSKNAKSAVDPFNNIWVRLKVIPKLNSKKEISETRIMREWILCQQSTIKHKLTAMASSTSAASGNKNKKLKVAHQRQRSGQKSPKKRTRSSNSWISKYMSKDENECANNI
jgi:hypothetical protein